MSFSIYNSTLFRHEDIETNVGLHIGKEIESVEI